MRSQSKTGGRRFRGQVHVFCVTFGFCTAAFAGDLNWVAKGGKRVPLARSTNELGVVLHRCEDVAVCKQRMADQNIGRIENFQTAPESRVKLLRLTDGARMKRDIIRQDPAIKEIRPVYRVGDQGAVAIGTNSLMIRVQEHLTGEERAGLWRDFNVSAASPVEGLDDVYQGVPPHEDGEVELAEAMSSDDRVVWAQPNFRRQLKRNQVAIDDPYFSKAWHLSNTGQLGGTSGADIGAIEAWKVTDGHDVLVGMFDDGLDVDHEDLVDGYAGTGHDPTLPASDPGFSDPRPKVAGDSHGTAVMGLAVARANTLGGRGVAFGARFTASRGLGELLTDVEIASVYTFARQQKVDVHINSWGLFNHPPNPQVIVDAIVLASSQGRQLGDIDGDGVDDPPRGMVIVFASGNDGLEIQPGFDLATLPEVISVGASGDNDIIADYSAFGSTLDVVGPSGVDFHAALFTTDVTDAAGNVENGLNDGGVDPETGFPQPDAAGKYIDSFAGTSASCPVVAGVAALMLSANPKLSATDVHLILEHTAVRIAPGEAQYNGITSHSNVYGHGRVKAGGAAPNVGAVEAARDAATNGGLTWPDAVRNLRVTGGSLSWRQSTGTKEFLVVQSDSDFNFIPVDGKCYDSRQTGCQGTTIEPLPSGVTVLAAGCGLACPGSPAGTCETGSSQCLSFGISNGLKMFGIFARNAIGRYSFGVSADSDGNVGGGGVAPTDETGGTTSGPAVTISVTPLHGLSPLRVSFNGNAVSASSIDDTRTSWDFDISDGIGVDASSRVTTHIYTVPTGETKTFFARLTMYDKDGHSGFAQAGIEVTGPADVGGGPVESGDLQIIIGLPASAGSNITEGVAPLSVLLSVDSSGLSGTLQSVVWDLGDGTRASSISVPHTYTNTGTTDLRIPITATVTVATTASTTASFTTTRILTIKPGAGTIDPGTPHLPGTTPGGAGGAATPCSGLGVIPLLVMIFSLAGMRGRMLRYGSPH